MKTAMQLFFEKLDEFEEHGIYPNDKMRAEFLETEKQQHEKTAIDMCNICLDNIGNPNSKMEEKFNDYWESNCTTNKETLK